jgi:hypothetical protein
VRFVIFSSAGIFGNRRKHSNQQYSYVSISQSAQVADVCTIHARTAVIPREIGLGGARIKGFRCSKVKAKQAFNPVVLNCRPDFLHVNISRLLISTANMGCDKKEKKDKKGDKKDKKDKAHFTPEENAKAMQLYGVDCDDLKKLLKNCFKQDEHGRGGTSSLINSILGQVTEQICYVGQYSWKLPLSYLMIVTRFFQKKAINIVLEGAIVTK